MKSKGNFDLKNKLKKKKNYGPFRYTYVISIIAIIINI